MKLTRKLIPAVAMLIISAVMMSTASFAWFTTNTQVDVEGIDLNVVAPINLLISNEEEGTYSPLVSYEAFGKKLIPASSADPTDTSKFFGPGEGSLFGDAGMVIAEKTTLDKQSFVSVADKPISESSDGYYADYVMYVKLVSGNDADKQTVNINFLTITGGAIAPAARVAVFLTDANSAKKVFLFSKTAGTTKAIAAAAAKGEEVQLADQTTVAAGSGLTGHTFDVGTTPIMITVRVWIEGQDAACINANAGTSLSVDMQFGINA